MTCPRVSVIIPSYNHAQFVGAALDSVLDQDFQDFEIVVTDDGSRDGTPEAVRRFTDPRISLEVFPMNQGACEAINHCIARARGEYVALLNSDDVFLPGKLSRQVTFLDANPAVGAVFGLAQFIDESGAALRGPGMAYFSALPQGRHAWLRRFFREGNALCHPSMMIRRQLYGELGPYDVRLRQLPDMDLFVRLCARHEIVVLPEVLVGFRVMGDGSNASAPSPVNLTRTVWEMARVLRRYWDMDEVTLLAALGRDIPSDVADRPWPAWVKLSGIARRDAPRWQQLFALETLERALALDVPGVLPRDLHAMTGALNPLHMHVDPAMDPVGRELLAAQAATAAAQRELLAARAELAAAQATATDAQRELLAARTELAAAQATATAAQGTLAVMQNSTSWWVTAPLRAAVARLKG